MNGCLATSLVAEVALSASPLFTFGPGAKCGWWLPLDGWWPDLKSFVWWPVDGSGCWKMAYSSLRCASSSSRICMLDVCWPVDWPLDECFLETRSMIWFDWPTRCQVIFGGGLEPMTSQPNSASVPALKSACGDLERIRAISGLTAWFDWGQISVLGRFF